MASSSVHFCRKRATYFLLYQCVFSITVYRHCRTSTVITFPPTTLVMVLMLMVVVGVAVARITITNTITDFTQFKRCIYFSRPAIIRAGDAIDG